MQSDEVTLNLTKNVHQLRQKLLQTEHSLSDLEQLAQRKYSSDEHSMTSSHRNDESSSTPAPLTMEELMLDNTLQSSIVTSELTFPLQRPKSPNRWLEEPKPNISAVNSSHSAITLSEHTISSNNVSTSFCALRPDTTYATMHLTSSPRKLVTSRPWLTERTMSPSFNIEEMHSVSDYERSQSFNSYNEFKNSLQRSQSLMTANLSQNQAAHRPTKTGSKNDSTASLPPEMCSAYSTVNFSHNTTNDISPQRPISARSNATSVTLTASDAESEQLKTKLHSVCSDNARLRTLVTHLRDDLDKYRNTMSYSLPSASHEHLSEKIACLHDEIKANEKTLRNTEDKLDYSQKLSVEKDHVINALKHKVAQLQALFEDCNKQKISAELAKESAAHDAAVLSQKLTESYRAMSNKMQESQSQARDKVSRAMNERTSMMKKFELVKKENESLQNKLRETQKKLKTSENENRSQEIDAARMMEQAQLRIRELVSELDEKRFHLKKCASDANLLSEENGVLKRQFSEMKEQNACQMERLLSSQKENEAAKAEIEGLKKSFLQLKQQQSTYTAAEGSQKNIFDDVTNQPSQRKSETSITARISPRKQRSVISELNMTVAAKETHIKRLEARISSYVADAEKLEALREELLTLGEKTRAGERRTHELEDVVHLMENERTKYLKKVNDLEDHIHDKTVECESLENRLKERTSNLNNYQRELEELNEKLSSFKSELKNKKDEVSTVTNKLEEMRTEEQLTRLRLSEVEAELKEKKKALDDATEWSGKQEAQSRREMKKIKKLHTEHCEELTEQIDTLQSESLKYKSQASAAKQQILLMNEQLVASSSRIQQLEREVDIVKTEEQNAALVHDEALKALEGKLSSSTSRIQSLEGALDQCKNEFSGCIEKLHETRSSFHHQIAMKCDHIGQLETELKLSQSTLKDEGTRVLELENALGERLKMLQDASSRIGELEESQSMLQSQLSKQEQHLNRETVKSSGLIEEMEGKLKGACLELDSKNRQFRELNDALQKVDEDFRECKLDLATVEAQVEDLHGENEEKSRDLERSRFEWQEMKSQLDAKIERVATLEIDLQKTERELEKSQEKVINLETEITKLYAQNEDALSQNSEMQMCGQEQKSDLMNKELTIKRLEEHLKQANVECEQFKTHATELEKSLEERQWQLQQRVLQLTQLDQQVREFRGGTEKRNVELENELEQVKLNLGERNAQVTHLDDQLTSMRSDIAEVRRLLAEEELNVKRMERELAQRNDRIEELTKSVEAERRAREDRHKACIEASQEVRLAREREQRICRDYQECQRELSRLRREQQQLLDEIDELGKGTCEKDDKLKRLSKKVSSLEAEKASVETKYQDELDRIQTDIQKMREDHQREMDKLLATNAQLLVRSKIATGSREEEIAKLLERECESRDEVERSRDAMLALERELQARKQVIEAANDTIVVKDAEIARLQTKMAGFERGAVMASLPNTPIKLNTKENQLTTSIYPFAPPTSKQQIPSSALSSPAKLHEISSASLLTGIDSDMGSFAPSFVPIAASTKRLPSTHHDKLDSSSFFLTSSPNNEMQNFFKNSEMSTEDDSLYRRVFADAGSSHVGLPSTSGAVITAEQSDSNRGHSISSLDGAGELRPERCMADLQERLRASEKRRREVSAKLRNLKGPVG